ncbi:MAG: amylo-alpha-1,6-glucosidase [Bacteroidales bacterium]
MKGGLFPNMGDNDNHAFNSVDAPLWFFQALWSYGLDPNETWKRYGAAIKDVLNAYRSGIIPGYMRKTALYMRVHQAEHDMDGRGCQR